MDDETEKLEKEAFNDWWNVASSQYPIKDPKTLAFEAWQKSRTLKPLEDK